MSGLEKFQANEAWRAHFKKLLLTERKLSPQPIEEVKEAQRFSLDLTEDLIVILEEKKIPRPEGGSRKDKTKYLNEKNMEKDNYKMKRFDDKKNVDLYEMRNRQSDPKVKFAELDNVSTIGHPTINYGNETILEEQELSQFEAVEKMCDKTASDPNSTLFKYLYNDKEESVEIQSKSDTRPRIRGYDAEAKALQRLLDQLRVEEQMQLENESPLKSVEVTQLEDIEAPSRLWDNTIVGENFQTSPVKMVGMLRPSTILEDAEELSSDSSSQLSFQSMSMKTGSEISSACYETAPDTTVTSFATNLGTLPQSRELEKDFCSSTVTKKTNECFSNNNINPLPEIKITEPNGFTNSLQLEQTLRSNEDLKETINLINLDQTVAPSPKLHLVEAYDFDQMVTIDSNVEKDKITTSEDVKESSESEDSVIEIMSDNEVDDSENSDSKIRNLCLPIKSESQSFRTHSLNRSDDFDDEKENSSGLDKSDDKSLHFNDTIEEVEYMMKKGMQYLAATNSGVKSPEQKKSIIPKIVKASPLKVKQDTFVVSPSAERHYCSPSPSFNKHIVKVQNGNVTQKSPIIKPKPNDFFAKEMKPFPKLDLFKKPMTSNANLRHKDVSVKQFSHIVSPIRAYINHTGNTPLMSNICSVSKGQNSSKAMQELERESRLYKPNFGGCVSTSGILQSSKKSKLPKKAYISSELKQLVDERTQVVIPGGKQYEKHIETALLPAVLRHEGKLKKNNDIGAADGTSHPHSRRGDSLADLSLMSGDISLYTIKDAQKF